MVVSEPLRLGGRPPLILTLSISDICAKSSFPQSCSACRAWSIATVTDVPCSGETRRERIRGFATPLGSVALTPWVNQ